MVGLESPIFGYLDPEGAACMLYFEGLRVHRVMSCLGFTVVQGCRVVWGFEFFRGQSLRFSVFSKLDP